MKRGSLYLLLIVPYRLAFGLPPQADIDRLRTLNPNVLTEAARNEHAQKLASNVRLRIIAANRRSSADWRQISDRAQWEEYAQQKLQLLEASLGTFPPPSKDKAVHLTQTLPGEGFKIENLVFESRPGLWVTANLYSPEPVRERMPGILLCHSHHNPKTQGELQDMGMTWARQGYLVLVMDQLGHGERRQHPFRSAADYAGPFEVNRQDYHFRYNLGIQLQLIGDSLMGWMVWDLRRGVDLLLARPGIDRRNIVLMGAVAGGGDPAAVTAAVDKRITAVVPFNFGGPQPEDPFPLLANPEESFNFAGNGSWESTRNLRLACQDGFLPWVIVGAIAPRRLIYAHEFSWDQANDPVWKRLLKIYGEFYQATGSPGLHPGLRSLERPASPGVALQQHRPAASRENSRGSHPLVSSPGELERRVQQPTDPGGASGADAGSSTQDSTPSCARHRCRAGPGARDGRVGSVGKARLCPAGKLASEQMAVAAWQHRSRGQTPLGIHQPDQ